MGKKTLHQHPCLVRRFALLLRWIFMLAFILHCLPGFIAAFTTSCVIFLGLCLFICLYCCYRIICCCCIKKEDEEKSDEYFDAIMEKFLVLGMKIQVIYISLSLFAAPLTIVLLFHLRFTFIYDEYITDDKNDETVNADYLQSWELSYLVWGFCNCVYWAVVFGYPLVASDSKFKYSKDPDDEDEDTSFMRLDFAEEWLNSCVETSFLPFGIDTSKISSFNFKTVYWVPALVNCLPAIVSGYFANYFFVERFNLECGQTDYYTENSDAIQFGNTFCITVSTHAPFDIFEFMSTLGGSIASGWAIVKIIGTIIIKFSGDVFVEQSVYDSVYEFVYAIYLNNNIDKNNNKNKNNNDGRGFVNNKDGGRPLGVENTILISPKDISVSPGVISQGGVSLSAFEFGAGHGGNVRNVDSVSDIHDYHYDEKEQNKERRAQQSKHLMASFRPKCGVDECGEELIYKDVFEAYGTDFAMKIQVYCDVCGRGCRFYVFNCPKGPNNEKHFGGYDLCLQCAFRMFKEEKKEINKNKQLLKKMRKQVNAGTVSMRRLTLQNIPISYDNHNNNAEVQMDTHIQMNTAVGYGSPQQGSAPAVPIQQSPQLVLQPVQFQWPNVNQAHPATQSQVYYRTTHEQV